ncbi:MAG: carboxypeptidase-like regulatory domain-containing protein [Bradymonadaceae bacterium]
MDRRPWIVGLVLILTVAVTACSDDEANSVVANSGGECPAGQQMNAVTGLCMSDGTGTGADGGGETPACVNLECRQVVCPSGSPTTTLSGTVTIPSGELPLPNAVVYVPNGPVDPIVQGASCERCDEELSGSAVVETTTNTQGKFVLEDVPVGADIPLVIQVGKWRRQITIPAVESCVDTPLDPVMTRLPRNQQEGDIPKIALTTGGYDALECLLRKIGIQASEFTPEAGEGRVNLFAGHLGSERYDDSLHAGTYFTPARNWWSSLDNLKKYDIILHSCEGEPDEGNKPQIARQALQDYADMGGRVFLSHWHNIWLAGGPQEFRSVASWGRGDVAPPDPVTAHIDTSFDKGQELADWMLETGGSAVHGRLLIREGRRTLDEVNPNLAQSWIWVEPTGTEWVQYFSFNTPVWAAEQQQCGRVVFSDIHVSSGDESRNRPFPTGCTTTGLSAQEKALVFMLFDLSSCIIPDQEGRCQGLGESCSNHGDCCSNLCATEGGQSTGMCIVG